jgi:DNA-binding NtrC family response regulator
LGKAPAPEAATGLAGAGTILVVDDEEIVRLTAQRGLERYGYRVMLASSGNEALVFFEQDPDAISLVLLDVTMPGLSGEETLRRLQSIRAGVKVVVSTGYGEMETTQRFAGTGIIGFLPKPYTAGRLAERIKSALSAEAPKI